MQIRLPFVIFALLLVVDNAAFAQQTVATVNDQPISISTVRYVLDQTLNRLPSVAANQTSHNGAAIKAGIEHCINREVVFQHLQQGKFATKQRETDQLLDDWKVELESTGQTLEQFLEQTGLSEVEFRRELAWQSSWRKHATEFVTEDHLRKQFDQRRRQLDGTQIHVAQILWKSSAPETLALAKKVRSELVSKKVDWASAVKTYSESASAKKGGDLGWIKFAGPMPRDFNSVAFGLKSGDFADPFVSRFGTHLIHCLAVQPGTKTFEDVAQELRESETKRLFELVAARHRPKAEVKLTGIDGHAEK
jgi:parvulin-like peptidyl-prolyl isomerase